MAMPANSNEIAPKFDHQYSNSGGLTWADQWDYNEEFISNRSVRSAKSNSKMGDCNTKMKSVASIGFKRAKSAASTGLKKAKSAASTGAKKAKAGTLAGLRWIKIQYNKRRNRTSRMTRSLTSNTQSEPHFTHDQISGFKYPI